MSLKAIKEAIIEGDEDLVVKLVEEELAKGTEAKEILDGGLVAGMDVVGEDFKNNLMFVPEVLMSANAMAAGNELLKPLMVGAKSESKGKVVIGTVKGDLHDIGKKIVGMMLEGAGFEVIDLGIDVTVEKFIGALQESQAKIVGMSAMLTTTMTVMGEVVEALRADDRFKDVKIMIGGAPVNDIYAEKIGANYSHDAASAVELAKKLAC